VSKSFRDSENLQWDIAVDVVTIKRVRDALDVNLLELANEESKLPERFNDPVFCVDVLYVLCRDQADSRNIDDIAFGRALTMDAIEEASDALMEGVVDFFRRDVRIAYRKVLDATRRVRKAQAKKLMEAMESPDLDRMLEAKIESLLHPEKSPTPLSSDATNSPDSPELIQENTPTQN